MTLRLIKIWGIAIQEDKFIPFAESIDLLGRGGPGVLPWRGLGCPQFFPSFPKRSVENALDNRCEDSTKSYHIVVALVLDFLWNLEVFPRELLSSSAHLAKFYH